MTRRIIYVVDALPSPPDSEEWPNTYMRGTVGLSEQVQLINDLTLGNLEYVGEWHSHPQGCSIEQSDQDLRAMEEISLEMSLGGLPGLMLIVGDEGSHRFYIGDPAFYTIDLPNKTP